MIKVRFPYRLFGLLLDEANKREISIPSLIVEVTYDYFNIPKDDREK
ncbi:hypothetical protein [Vibrio paucivorans]|uniref:Uncharacterized protein n=1 Tax=Vibrio paucivorans TaxID=2829489 RepID=A0A9X3CIN4_9VIBR|nr:hypothetical protein [Vibrio paucivorans]MCW8336588.1 hypothetical protein [Vibrio paucivorans]